MKFKVIAILITIGCSAAAIYYLKFAPSAQEDPETLVDKEPVAVDEKAEEMPVEANPATKPDDDEEVYISDLAKQGDDEALRGAGMNSRHFAVFDRYCLNCHDAESEEGNVNLENLSFNVAQNIQTAELWDTVLNVVNSGEMPPKDKRQIPAQDKLEFLRDLSHAMVAARTVLSDSGGEVTMRRLNRREYINSIVSLTGLEPDPDTYLLLPKDEDLDGFDTNGATLNFSSQQFELYRTIARDVLTKLIQLEGIPKPRVQKVRVESEHAPFAKHSKRYKDLKARRDAAEAYLSGKRGGNRFVDEKAAKRAMADYRRFSPQLVHYLKQRENKDGHTLMIGQYYNDVARSETLTPRTGGKYIVRYRLGAKNDPTAYESYVKLTGAGLRKVTGTVRSPETITVEVDLQPSNEPMAFSASVRDNLLKNQRWRRFGRTLGENGVGPEAHIWVDWIEFEGPYHDTWPAYQLGEIIIPQRSAESHESYVRRVLENFARKAFRDKAPSPQYIDSLLQIYLQEGGNAGTFKRAIVEPLSIILASPSFLFLAEPRAGEEKQRITDRELAVRLAYFLWSAPPDKELLDLARAGTLSDPFQLKRQTERLLADPRSKAFVEGFTYQWLGMVEVDTFQFSAEEYPEFDEYIRDAAKQEIYETVGALLQRDGALKFLVNNDFVFVNDLLADYYGISGVKGPEYRPVKVPSGSPRGGLLGMAALHILGSDGTRVNLVKRGTWVLTHLLYDEPPPPPADVPMLSRLGSEPMPEREILKLHMEEPQCAQCHQSIDPVGYGLQNFDAAGQWRKVEGRLEAIHEAHKKLEFPIDASGELPLGAQGFRDYFEFREQVGERSPYFSRGYIEALIAYALGRDYSIADFQLAHDLYKKAQVQGDTMRAYIHGLIQSPAFSSK
ncbi:MAG: DUF1592 domain-containing protein [Opitutales bacterium]